MKYSIIITSFNQKNYICQAVASALVQRNSEVEVIVVDDGSTDGSLEMLRGYGNAIRMAALPVNCGAAAARNRGVELSCGDYLAFLDGDDAFAPWAMRVYDHIVRTVQPKLILAGLLWFSGELPVPRAGEHPREVHFAEYEDYMRKDRTFCPGATAFIVERRTLLSVGGWSVDFPVMEDLDLLMKLSDAGPIVQILSPHTAFYRVHPGNTCNNVSRYLEQVERMLHKEREGIYPGGRGHRFDRYALMGGHVLGWVRRAHHSGMYRNALALAARGWPMVFASAVRKSNVALKGPRPYATFAI